MRHLHAVATCNATCRDVALYQRKYQVREASLRQVHRTVHNDVFYLSSKHFTAIIRLTTMRRDVCIHVMLFLQRILASLR